MSRLSLAVGKIVRRLDKRIFSVARAAKRPYSITNRLCCKTEKADEKNTHVKGPAHSSPFSHEVSEWDKKLLLWSGRFKKKEDIPQHISAKMMSATRSKLRVKVAYFAMAILLMGFLSAVLIGKQPRIAWVPAEEPPHPNEISSPSSMPAEDMLWILSAKEFQQAGSRRDFSVVPALWNIIPKDVKKYRSLRYMQQSVEEIEETAESTSAKP